MRQPWRHPGFGGDVLHAGLVVAALDQRAVGRVDDPLLRLIGHSASSPRPPLAAQQIVWSFNQSQGRMSTLRPQGVLAGDGGPELWQAVGAVLEIGRASCR